MLEAIIDNYSEVIEEIAKTTEYLDKLVLRNPKSELLRSVEWKTKAGRFKEDCLSFA